MIGKLLAFIRNDRCYWCAQPMQIDTKEAPDFCTIEHLIPRRGSLHEAYIVLAHRWCNNNRDGMPFRVWVDLLTEARGMQRFPWEIRAKDKLA